MRKFNDPPSALAYVVESLIPKGIGFIVNVVGPTEKRLNHAATLQIVDQNKAYNDGEKGITLYLPFDPESGMQHSHELFKLFANEVPFDDVTYDGIPCYAIKFGTNVPAALCTLEVVLKKVFEYPELTAFECVVHEG